jgi:hypothetical protein
MLIALKHRRRLVFADEFSLGFACAQIRSYSLCSLRSNVAVGLFSLTNFRTHGFSRACFRPKI